MLTMMLVVAGVGALVIVAIGVLAGSSSGERSSAWQSHGSAVWMPAFSDSGGTDCSSGYTSDAGGDGGGGGE